VSLTPPGPEPEVGPVGSARSRGWRRAVRTAYVAVLVVAAVAVLVLRRDEIRDLLTGARILPLLGALALGLVSLVQSAWFWSRCLGHLGSPQPVGRVLEATVAAVPARYLPGSVWFAAGRVAHLRQAGTPAVTLGIVAVLETLLSFVVAVGMAGALLLVAGRDDSDIGVLELIAAALVLALLASPWVVNPLVRWVSFRRGLGEPPQLTWRAYLELGGHLVVFWAASAAAFLCYLSAFPAVSGPGAVRTAGTFLLAWSAGFIAVFAPQGAGVFEASMAALLDGPLAALALVIAGYRGLTALRDVTALAALTALRSARGRG
jgi:hypothetical protein